MRIRGLADAGNRAHDLVHRTPEVAQPAGDHRQSHARRDGQLGGVTQGRVLLPGGVNPALRQQLLGALPRFQLVHASTCFWSDRDADTAAGNP